MSDRLPTHLVVAALLRRANDAGGLAVVRAKGDAQGGTVLLLISESGGAERVLERAVGSDGRPALVDTTPPGDVDEYWQRRRRRDPDLWVVALDTADAERFAAETIMAG